MEQSSRFLRKVLHREVRTHYTISEMLECGHRFESLTLMGDSLTAKHRTCPKCAQAISLPLRKPAASAAVPCDAQGSRRRVA